MRRAKIATAIKKNISVIPASPEFNHDTRAQYKRLRITAYCRVSTLQEQQEISYEAQVNYYTEKINSNPEWVFVGIYADNGKDAIMTHKRSGPQTMIDDCMVGKTNMVTTKPTSRPARSTVGPLAHARKLKAKGVAVHLRKKNINTLEDGGEMLTTVLSSQVQEESRNLSENVHRGYVRQFKNEVVYVDHNKLLGYTKDEEGNLVIVPDKAKLVHRIFRLYPKGSSINKIAEASIKEGIRTMTENTMWHITAIPRMLMSGKYMGGALLQRTHTADFLEKKRTVNKGIVLQYYIEGNHEATTPQKLFYQVQEERVRRANVYRPIKKKGTVIRGEYNSKYMLADIVYCKEYGQSYRGQVWVNGGTRKLAWCCCSRLKSGTKKYKHSLSLEEKALHEAIMKTINPVIKDEGELIDILRDNAIRILSSRPDSVEPTEYDERIDALQKQVLALAENSTKTESTDEEFDRAHREITDQIRTFKKKRIELSREKQLTEARDQRAEGMGQYIQKANYLKRQSDDELVR